MDPLLLQAAFRLGFVILFLALLVLPFEDRSSPEFVAAVLAVVVGLIFVGLVTVLARSTLPPPPRASTRKSVDKASARGYYVAKSEETGRSTTYNESDSRSGGVR